MNKRCLFLSNYLKKIDGAEPRLQIGKHVKMATDAFLFLRGSAQLFYADIASNILTIPSAFNEVPQTTIMGDCHISNFGFFTEEGSHGDNVIFAPNDFDDACIGPAIWDLARYIVSLKLAADYGEKISQGKIATENKYHGKLVIDQAQVIDAITNFLTAYSQTCQNSISDPKALTKSYESFTDDHILFKPYQKALRRGANGNDFETKSSLAKATIKLGDSLKFKDQPNKFVRIDDTQYQEIVHHFSPYVDDNVLDVVARVGAGTGSLNLARYYLLVGPECINNNADLTLCHIVEVKQQRYAAPLYHFDNGSPRNQLNPAHLTVQCQRRMQRNPDLVLDEVEWKKQYWLVRSRHHAKVGIAPEQVVLGKKAVQQRGLAQFTTVCGQTLALAHCRNDRRSTRFEQSMCSVLEQNKHALTDACLAYAKQVELDTLCLTQLLNS